MTLKKFKKPVIPIGDKLRATMMAMGERNSKLASL